MQEGEQGSLVFRLENTLPVLVMAAMCLLPLVEVAGRKCLGQGIPGSIVLVQHLTLWIAILGAMLAARSERMLALSTPSLLPDRFRPPVKIVSSALAAGVTATLLLASLDLVRIERAAGEIMAWGIPTWTVLAVLPAGFASITSRLIQRSSATRQGQLIAACGLCVPVAFGVFTSAGQTAILLPAAIVIVGVTILGMPIFAAIGGLALLLFWVDGTPLNAVPGETYRLTVNAMLPAIPLFALAGYVLAEGGSGRRLSRLFNALVGWMPGGAAFAITLVLAFFTPLTGASGVTILSMGGLFLPVLLKARYPHQTSVGLITVSGSIGLLFFPSLPVFLYAFYANQPFEKLFIGGLLPGMLLVLVVGGWAALRGYFSGGSTTRFETGEAAAALWESKWELLLPFTVLAAFVGGYATLVESAALTVLLAVLIECFIYRDLGIRRDLPRVVLESSTLVGGFMIILCVALGFTNYLIIARVPSLALAWVQANIESPLLFLLVLNIFLIIVGALMDIYSAIIVVVPLVIPMAAAYGIDPIHLGIIFLSNMELGYLMPPMGENLFLSAYRFDQSLTQIYRSTLPYVLILSAAVLVITYAPIMTLGLVELLTR